MSVSFWYFVDASTGKGSSIGLDDADDRMIAVDEESIGGCCN